MTIMRRLFGFTVPMVVAGYGWCMQRLALFAIAIDDVRDIFGAHADLAERLRDVAATRFAPPVRKRSFFRPLLTRDPALGVDPALPSRRDVDALLAGGYIEPERLPQSWAIFTAWLEELSSAAVRADWDAAQFERIEWNLATAGLSSDFSLRRLAERPLGVPLHPLPGQLTGYCKHVHAVDTLHALTATLANPKVSDEAARLARQVSEVLRATGSALDVVVVGE